MKKLKTDPAAGVEEAMDRYAGLIHAVVRMVLPGSDPAEIEDCVSDVFLAFYEGLSDFRAEASVKNYLCLLAKNKATDRLRRRTHTAPADDELILEIPDPSDVEQTVVEKALLGEILKEIRAMGPPDSDILFRKYYLGQQSKQIAEALSLTVTDVDTRTHRAIAKLRKQFGGTNS